MTEHVALLFTNISFVPSIILTTFVTKLSTPDFT